MARSGARKPILDKKKLLESQQDKLGIAFNTIFTSAAYTWEFTDTENKAMMYDVDIKKEIDKRKRGVNSRILTITGEGKQQEILQDQFNDLNLTDAIDVVLDSKFIKYSIQEIMYNDDLTIRELKEMPNEWYTQQWNDTLKKYEWVLSYGTSLTGINTGHNWGEAVPFAKYLIPVHRPTPMYINGRSELEPLYKWWKIKENALTYANEIVEKYGGVITWFLYNPDTSTADLQEMVTNISGLTNGSQIPIPEKPGGMAQGLNHEFGFITQNDLKIGDIHINLMDYCSKKISEYLTGSSISESIGQSGSYSSANAGIQLLDQVIESDVMYVENWLEWLVYYQSLIFGFNWKEYKVKLEKRPDQNQKADINKKRIENFEGIKRLGYDLDVEFMSKELGIPIENFVKSILPIPFTAEFEKKKTIDNLKAEEKKIDNEIQLGTQLKMQPFTEELTKLYIEAFEKVKSKAGIDKVDVNFVDTSLDENLIFFRMLGMYLVQYRDVVEFEEEYTLGELFTLPFEEAIKYFSEKIPRLYDEIEEITAQSIRETFWIKKITNLEVVKKMKLSLEKTIELGGTFKEWKEDIKGELKKVGISKDGYYVENVFRTNTASVYNAGRQDQQLELKDILVYMLYNGIDDDRQSEICRNLDGKVWRNDDPILNEIYPPNHYGCRSIVTALREDQLSEYGLSLDKDQQEVLRGLEEVRKGDFDNNPSNYVQKLEQIAVKKETEQTIAT